MELKTKNIISRNDTLIILGLFALNLILKAIYINANPLDLDEPFTVYHGQGSLSELMKIFEWENNPPLFFVLMHFWVKIFGISTVSVRFLPMLFGSFTVIFVYKIGTKFFNHYVAFGSSILYTFSNIIIQESHDARAYTLLVFLSVASMYFFLSLIQHNKRKDIIYLIIINALLIYTHFMGFFILVIQGVFVLFIEEVRVPLLKKYLISSFLTILLYSPYMLFFIARFSNAVENDLTYGGATSIIDLLRAYTVNCSNDFVAAFSFFAVLISFLLIVLFNNKKLTIYTKIIIGWFCIIFIVYGISYKISIITIPRYLILVSPGFFILLSIACYYHKYISKALAVVLGMFVIFLMIKTVDLKAAHRLDAKSAINLIHQYKTDSTIVLVYPYYIEPIVAYHHDIQIYQDYGYMRENLENDNIFPIASAHDIDSIPSFENMKQIIFLEGWHQLSSMDPDREIFNRIKKQYPELDLIRRFVGYSVYKFQH